MMTRTRPVAPADWDDVVAVLGQKGGYSGCWCTFWRMTNREAATSTPDDNEAILRSAVRSGEPTGVLAYEDGEPAGWCSISPRTIFARVLRSTSLRPTDPEEPGVWAVVCVYVRKEHRGRGVVVALLNGAVEYAREQGARVVEGYPVLNSATKKRTVLSSGTVDQFTAAGFDLYNEPSAGRRLIMRRPLG